MQISGTAGEELLDLREKRMRRIYPLLLLTTVYKQFWCTIGAVILVFTVALPIVIGILWGFGILRDRPPNLQMIGYSLVGLTILAAFVALVFFFDLATRRFTIAGGIVWLLLSLVALIQLVEIVGLFLRAVGTLDAPPAIGLPLLVLLLLALFVAFHYVWVVFRGAFTLLLLPARERKVLREASVGASFMSRLLVGLWSMPPTFEFARRPRARFIAIFMLAVAGSLCVSLANVLLLLSAFPLPGRAGWIGTVGTAPPGILLAGFFLILAIFALLLALGGGARTLMRRLVRISLEDLQRVDARTPILFLRAFGDDQVPLKPSKLALLGRLLEVGQRRTNLDRMLLDEATGYGPVVGLGNPYDKRPPYGAARGYFDDKTWQQAVADLARNSRCVVICIDDTDGIWWEVEHLSGGRYLPKTMFVMHPKHAKPAANAKLCARIARALALPPAAAERLTAPMPLGNRGRRHASVLAFYFSRDGTLRALRSSTFSHFAYLLAAREFLRETLGLAPRPINAQNAVKRGQAPADLLGSGDRPPFIVA